MKRVKLTRLYHFSAAHRLHSPYLDEAQNRELYRECNNPGGHGHNYVLAVTVAGEVPPRTGMIVDLGRLDGIVQARVLDRVDHQFIGRREFGPGDEAYISTSETIACQIWGWLAGSLPAGLELVRVLLEETPLNHFEVTAGQEVS